jgi:hypothetical protein
MFSRNDYEFHGKLIFQSCLGSSLALVRSLWCLGALAVVRPFRQPAGWPGERAVNSNEHAENKYMNMQKERTNHATARTQNK